MILLFDRNGWRFQPMIHQRLRVTANNNARELHGVLIFISGRIYSHIYASIFSLTCHSFTFRVIRHLWRLVPFAIVNIFVSVVDEYVLFADREVELIVRVFN